MDKWRHRFSIAPPRGETQAPHEIPLMLTQTHIRARVFYHIRPAVSTSNGGEAENLAVVTGSEEVVALLVLLHHAGDHKAAEGGNGAVCIRDIENGTGIPGDEGDFPPHDDGAGRHGTAAGVALRVSM